MGGVLIKLKEERMTFTIAIDEAKSAYGGWSRRDCGIWFLPSKIPRHQRQRGGTGQDAAGSMNGSVSWSRRHAVR